MNTGTDLREGYRYNERLTTLANHVIVSLMLVCVMAVGVFLGERIMGAWDGSYLIVLAFFFAMESMATQRMVKRLDAFSLEWLKYRATEWVVILVVLKLVTYQQQGFDRLWADLPLWRANFFTNFFTNDYIFNVVAIGMIWVLGSMFSFDLSLLEGDEKALAMERESRISEERVAIRRSLSDFILLIGAMLGVMTAFLYLDQINAGGGRSTFRGALVSLVAYFVLSLVLLSLTQFSILRAFWSLERIPISPQLASRWVIYSLVFLTVLALVTSVLPTGYSVGLLDVLGYLFGLLVMIINLILLLLMAPLILLLSLLALLMGGSESTPPIEMPRVEPPPPPPMTGDTWLDVLKSIAFWVLFFGVIVYSLVYYIQQHKEVREVLDQFFSRTGLKRVWEVFWGWLVGVNRAVAGSVQRQLARLRERQSADAAGSSWRFTSLRRMTPRQRVQFFYLAMLRRSSERGLPRQPSETPREYSATLRSHLQNADEDVETITAEFVEARYSRHEITPEDASQVRVVWEHLKRALRKAIKL